MRRIGLVIVCVAAAACARPEKGGTGSASARGAGPQDMSRVKVSEVIAPAPRFVDHVVLGSELAKDGTVAKQSTTFTPGQPVYLTIVLLESPTGLQTSAVWRGPDKKPLLVQRKQMNGTKVVTFSFKEPKIKPGHYHVTAYWGGNIASENEFDVVPAQKAKGKKG